MDKNNCQFTSIEAYPIVLARLRPVESSVAQQSTVAQPIRLSAQSRVLWDDAEPRWPPPPSRVGAVEAGRLWQASAHLEDVCVCACFFYIYICIHTYIPIYKQMQKYIYIYAYKSVLNARTSAYTLCRRLKTPILHGNACFCWHKLHTFKDKCIRSLLLSLYVGME